MKTASFKRGRESNNVLRIYFNDFIVEIVRNGLNTLNERIAFRLIELLLIIKGRYPVKIITKSRIFQGLRIQAP